MEGMFAAIGAYIKNIALIMLLAVLAEMTLPDAGIKKYVSVVIGIVMIFAVGGRIFSFIGALKNTETAVPELSLEKETYDVKDKLTGLIYDEMGEVDDRDINTNGLDIKVERVSRYGQNTNGEVVE